ncbi:hypothetical protein ACFLWN_01680 [Chloroflexota bacterium]
MAVESACIPVPREIIMPLAGWMLVKERSLPVTYTLLAGFLRRSGEPARFLGGLRRRYVRGATFSGEVRALLSGLPP